MADSFQSSKVSASELSSSTKFNNFVQAVEDAINAIPLDQVAPGSAGQVATTSGGVAVWSTPVSGTFFPIDLRNPQTAANAGNSFPTVEALTDWEAWHWQFVKDVDGKLYGVVRLPAGITPATPQIHLEIGANATSGVTRLSVATKAIADGESMNPAALTSETAQDITVPGTARFRKTVSFTITETLAASDLIMVEVFHEGAHANDTLAVNTMLYGAYLKVA